MPSNTKKTSKKLTKRFLGVVAVDSGQLLITDPCYIDSHWENKPFEDIRIYKLKQTNQFYIYAPSKTTNTLQKFKHIKKSELFANYEQKMKNGETINQMREANKLEKIPSTEKEALIGDYSYAGCCETNQKDQNDRQLLFKTNVEGAGVTFSSGYGDGCYAVWGFFNKENRCLKVEIIMG
mgnify:FL=1